MPCFGGQRKAPSFKIQTPEKLQILSSHTAAQTGSLDWLFMQILHDCVGPVVGAELFKDFLQVTVDGPGADAKQFGDFLIRMAFAEQRKDLVFSLGQLRQLVCRTADRQGGNRFFKVTPHTISNFLAGEKSAFPSRSNRRQDPRWRGASEQIAGGAARSRLKQLVGVLINRKEHASDFGSGDF